MRVYLRLSPNTEACPFDYQSKLVGCLHNWLGENQVHDRLSLYSMSWLTAGRVVKKRFLDFAEGAVWFISSPDVSLIKQVIRGVQERPDVAFGMRVEEIILKEAPNFGSEATFRVATPVLVKRYEGDRTIHYSYKDTATDALLTETLCRKLEEAGLGCEGVKVTFDRTYTNAKQKLVTYKGTGNKANICPVRIQGSPEVLAFAWNVGIGNSTGIGFGALH